MRSIRSKSGLIIASACVVWFFSGCAKAPDAELAAAKAALEAAKNAGADKYMSKNYQGIKNAIESAESEIQVQNATFFMNRKYKKPTEVLVRATKVANEIAAEAPKIKAEVDGQVKDNLNVVQSMLKETANDIKKMSRKKDKALIAELNANLASADSAAAQAATDFNAGEVMKAASSLEQVQKLIKKITTALKPPADEPQM